MDTRASGTLVTPDTPGMLNELYKSVNLTYFGRFLISDVPNTTGVVFRAAVWCLFRRCFQLAGAWLFLSFTYYLYICSILPGILATPGGQAGVFK